MPSALVVFTGRSTATLLAERGSGCWTASAARALETDYVVCTWNSKSILGEDEGVPHGAAFLIGRISGVEPCHRDPIPGRVNLQGVRVQIDQYASVNVNGIWRGLRSPFFYVKDVEQVLGLNLQTLDWHDL